ncbi:MAG: PEP-CTERM sorting domain-containing protein [Acidobacteria bacterium]|nr:PEP-CTERM sorting domain-containing protein [Acidobacteriota bacterium]
MKRAFWLGILPFAFASPGFATSCGTLAAPISCNITVNGTNTYTVTGLALSNVNASGGGNLYQPGDIDIDIGTGGGLSMLLTFSKHNGSPTPGIVFLANPGETAGFTVAYTVTLSTPGAGSVAFTTPDIVTFPISSASTTGLATTQMVLNDGVNGTSCQAIRNSVGLTQGNCNSLPANTTSFLNVGNIVSLSANSGNSSIGSFTNLIDSDFTPSRIVVPEPSTYALMGLGLAGLLIRRFRS